MTKSIGLFTIIYLVGRISAADHWDYEDQKSWSRNYPDCGRNKQSPIDIKSGSAVLNRSMLFFRDKYENVLDDVIVINNGHTAQLKFKAQPRWKPMINGPALNYEDYVFEQLHFHWSSEKARGSEHAVDGKTFAMEMHLVHWNKKYDSMASAMSQKDGLAVIGVFFEVTRRENLYLNPLIEAVANVNLVQQTAQSSGIILDHFLPDNIDLFYRYKGSLTTPPCYESVTWLVFDQPNGIGAKQIQKFRELKNAQKELLGATFRELQPVGDRVVFVSDKKNNARLTKPIKRRYIWGVWTLISLVKVAFFSIH